MCRKSFFEKKRNAGFLICLFPLSVLTSSLSMAQNVLPMSFDLSPSGTNSETSLRIENSSDDSFPFEIVVSKILPSEDGRERWEPNESDFLLFPPSAIVDPGNTQAVRVRYIGDPNIQQSESYRVSVKQVPVDLSGTDQAAIGVSVNFNALANVVPDGAEPQPVVRSIEAKGEDKWHVQVENKGTSYLRLSRADWSFEGPDGSSNTVEAKEIAKQLDGSSLLFPDSIKTFLLPAQPGFDPSNTKISINIGS